MNLKFSLRKLHLPSERTAAQELDVRPSGRLDAFLKLYRTASWVLKVHILEGELTSRLLSVFSIRSVPCWPIGSNAFYLFSDRVALDDWCRLQTFASPEEEIFLKSLREFLERYSRSEFEMVNDRYVFQFGGPTRIMGILNVTPDSFSDGGEFAEKNAAVERGFQMEEEGADIIDLGGESTRPGSLPVSESEELARILPVIEGLSGDLQIPISVDTYKSQVAEAAIQAGATIVNDISGLSADPHMREVIAHYSVPVVLMHIKGTPRDMQINPHYDNLMDELYLYFEERIATAEAAGIERSRIIIDPGLGFGKRLWDNYEILQRMPEFRGLGCPVLAGPSRKSFIGKVLDLPAHERLEGTAAAVAAAIAGGVQVIRVHDIEKMLRVVQIADLVAGNVVFEEQEATE